MKYPSLEKLPERPARAVNRASRNRKIDTIFPVGPAVTPFHGLARLADAQAEGRIASVGLERRHQVMSLRSYIAHGKQGAQN